MLDRIIQGDALDILPTLMAVAREIPVPGEQIAPKPDDALRQVKWVARIEIH